MPNQLEQSELYILLKESLQDAGLDDEELGLVYHCHLYTLSGGKFFPGHRLMTIIHKLITYIVDIRKRKEQ